MSKKFTITCYGQTRVYPEKQRKEQINFYFEAMRCCEGSEAERYRNIYCQLLDGKRIINDNSNF